ncbi:MAG: GtrA family protein [Leptospiraceae bacterium]|nr:GtrA family protein [Leptospiraceae bacterium]
MRSLRQSFWRTHLASLIATGADYTVTIIFVEIFHLWYVIATAMGSLIGALLHFLAGRYWAFEAKHKKLFAQSLRYGFTAICSFLLNTGLVFLLAEYLFFQYIMAKIVASVLVGVGFNFTMHRYFVFGVHR